MKQIIRWQKKMSEVQTVTMISLMVSSSLSLKEIQ